MQNINNKSQRVAFDLGGFRATPKHEGASEAQRKTWTEFCCMASATNQIRAAFKSLSPCVSKPRTTGRISKALFKVINSDCLNTRGYRNVAEGDISLMAGFQFNDLSPFPSIFKAPYFCKVNRKTGRVEIVIPPFDPAPMVRSHPGATHFQIISGSAEIDFERTGCIAEMSKTGLLRLADKVDTPICLEHQLTPGSQQPFFVTLGIENYMQYHDEELRIGGDNFNALQIIRVYE